MFGHIVGLFSNPVNEWQLIRKKLEDDTCQYTMLVFLLALLPPVCGFIGTTQFGWQIGTAAPVKLTVSSALTISVGYYFAIVLGIFIMGYVIKWMGQTYVKSVRLSEAVALAAFVSVPLLLVGVFMVLWSYGRFWRRTRDTSALLRFWRAEMVLDTVEFRLRRAGLALMILAVVLRFGFAFWQGPA